MYTAHENVSNVPSHVARYGTWESEWTIDVDYYTLFCFVSDYQGLNFLILPYYYVLDSKNL